MLIHRGKIDYLKSLLSRAKKNSLNGSRDVKHHWIVLIMLTDGTIDDIFSYLNLLVCLLATF